MEEPDEAGLRLALETTAILHLHRLPKMSRGAASRPRYTLQVSTPKNGIISLPAYVHLDSALSSSLPSWETLNVLRRFKWFVRSSFPLDTQRPKRTILFRRLTWGDSFVL